MTAQDILTSGFDTNIAKAIIGAYTEIERNYVLRKWKPSELDAGHFVEAVRRALDFEFRGTYKAFNKSLPPFNDQALKVYENQSGDQSFRLLIPRNLKSIYNIRNKRGVAHISDVDPNEMDATLILYSVKWVLAELVRLKSGLSVHDTQILLDEVVERHHSIIWKHGDIKWVLDPSIKTREQVLILLYDDSPMSELLLQDITEYKNSSNFRKIINRLHDKKLIHCKKDGYCQITPTGVVEAERIIAAYQ